MSSPSESVPFVLPAGGNARTHAAGRTTCCRDKVPATPTFQPVKRFVDRCVIGEVVPIQVESVADFSPVLQPFWSFTVVVVVFDPKTVNNDSSPNY